MNYNKLLAGAFVGAGAIILLLKGEYTSGVAILSGMMGFFIGDQNGRRETESELIKLIEDKKDGREGS